MEKLFSEFAPVSPSEWKSAIEKDLKGIPFEKVKWKTEDGFLLEPFYTEFVNRETPLFRKDRQWSITEVISKNGSIDSLQSSIKEALDSGADSVQLHSYSLGGAKSGIEIESGQELERFVKGVPLKSGQLFLSLGTRAPSLFAQSPNVFSNEKFFTDYDPFGTALLCGEISENLSEDWKANLSKLANGKHIAIHSVYLREAGASVLEELSNAVAWYAEYLSILLEKGVSLEQSLRSIWFWTGTGTDYFQEIAKLRALRLLASQVIEAFGEKEPKSIFVHSSNLSFQQTIFDPHVNLLRNTSAAMSAVLGGADSVSVLPFESNHSKKDPNADRIARNTQLLLKNESYFDKVLDPSLGSYYIENLTNILAEKAWTEFQSLESKGGFLKAMETGEIQKRIQASGKHKLEQVSSKKTILLGTNQYPLAKEHVSGLDKIIADDKNRKEFSKQTTFERILPIRASEEFDAIRLLVETSFSKTGKLPKVCLLPIGDAVMRKARASFSSNLLSCMGFEIQDHSGFASLEDVPAYLDLQLPEVIVLCSSDEEYNALVPSLSKMLGSVKKKPIFILAGYPTDKVKEFESLGVQEFIHLKRNLIETFRSLVERLGLSS